MPNDTHEWRGDEAVLVETYDATELLNAPFKVILKDSVKEVRSAGGRSEIIVPDPEGLVKAVAQARVLHPHKLNGAELKFLRSALELKSRELAKAIAVTPEHVSRLEADDKVLSPQSEMLVRIFTYLKTLPYTPKKESEASKIVEQVSAVFGNLSIKSCRSVEEELCIFLVRVSRNADVSGHDVDESDGAWNEQLTSKVA